MNRPLKRIQLPACRQGRITLTEDAEVLFSDYLRFLGEGGKICSDGFVLHLAKS
jgi:hypothetical protein